MSRGKNDRDRRPRGPDYPVSLWKERELMRGELVEAAVFILGTRGCSWAKTGGCTMCGYSHDSRPNAPPDMALKQLENALDHVDGAKVVKLYTSGSFLDDKEVSPEARRHILELLVSRGIELVVFESRPEYVVPERIRELGEIVNLEVAIGLESSNDSILEGCINKGFHYSDYIRAAEVLKDSDARLRTYLLLKPPYLTEATALEDVKKSISDISDYADVISINPMNIQRGTIVEGLWRSGQYRTPWLWSVVDALLTPVNVRLVSSPTGGGGNRGAHNCGRCDRDILGAIEAFSLGGGRQILETVISTPCRCKETWLDQREYDSLIGYPTNIESWKSGTWR